MELLVFGVVGGFGVIGCGVIGVWGECVVGGVGCFCFGGLGDDFAFGLFKH